MSTVKPDAKVESPDLRHGVTGVVTVGENFVGSPPTVRNDGPSLASPDVGVKNPGQSTHE
jgi:hypothetical protein